MKDISPSPDDRSNRDERIDHILARTPARLLSGRAGSSYRTKTWLKLRLDHAAARDAVHTEPDIESIFGIERIARFGLFPVSSRAISKREYLMRPDLGRQLDPPSRNLITERCTPGVELQVVIGDGLSATAVEKHSGELLERLAQEAAKRNWSFGRPFLVRFCRVGLINDVGDLLDPEVVVLLIGERPGLATAESLSAYLAYRPRSGHTNAERNLISNIHTCGVSMSAAVERIWSLAEQIRTVRRSGVGISEILPSFELPKMELEHRCLD